MTIVSVSMLVAVIAMETIDHGDEGSILSSPTLVLSIIFIQPEDTANVNSEMWTVDHLHAAPFPSGYHH